jgi:hypothetical protein
LFANDEKHQQLLLPLAILAYLSYPFKDSMKNLLLFVFLILALVLVQFAEAQSVNEIIEKHISARGGKENLRGLHAILIEGTKKVSGTEFNVSVLKYQEKYSRTDYKAGGEANFSIITPEKGWSLLPATARVVELPRERVEYLQPELDIAGPLVDYDLKQNRVEMLGREMLNDVPVHVVRVTLPNGKELVHYIDEKSYVLHQIASRGQDEKGEIVEQITQFTDWRKVRNVYFPFAINVVSPNGTEGPLVVQKITLNEEVNLKMTEPE